MHLFFLNTFTVYSPMCGEVIALDDVDDSVFKNRMLGNGVAIKPTNGKVYAPFDGKIVHVADTLHSVIIRSKRKLTFMIHMGIDTVYLKGEGFKCFVTEGQRIKRGDLIFEMDLNKIIECGKQTVTPVIIMDKKTDKLFIADKKNVTKDDKLFEIKL